VRPFAPCNCGGQPAAVYDPCGRLRLAREDVDLPDLAIYSQAEQATLGNAPSWDNPDIITNLWGPFRLMDETEVVVRNLSPTAPAINALVHYFVAPFGIGTPATLLQTRSVSLAPGAQTKLIFPLDKETHTGDPRVGVHVRIEHPHDGNAVNNIGSQVHDGSFTSEIGHASSVQIPVLNNSDAANTMQLTVLPTPVEASIEPTSHTFAPHEQILATLRFNVPASLSGKQSVTVVGRFGSGALVGGATKLIDIDS
jgi:hypothetical protein